LAQHFMPRETQDKFGVMPVSGRQAGRLKAKFRDLDQDRDGTLDCQELLTFLQKGDPSFSAQSAQTLFEQCDVDADGRINFDEFVDLVFSRTETSFNVVTDHYTDKSSIREALRGEKVVLLRDTWLLQLYHAGGVLPRRQDLPDGAVWSVHERIWEREDLSIISISYCWLTKKHPDPDGKQLHTFIGPVLELFLRETRRAAVFIDWCSLYQHPRSRIETRMFNAALKDINLWYAHKQTLVWMLTSTPPGVTAYMDRGWPCFERAISFMICDSDKVLDLGTLEADWDVDALYSDVRDMCISARPPPIAPEHFEQMLRTKHFTNGADKEFVATKYAQTFHDVMGCAEDLNYSKLQWGDADLPDLCEAMPFCHRLQHMSLARNQIRDDTLLSQYLATGACCLQALNLAGNELAGISTSLAQALKSSSVLVRLNLSANGILNIDPLGEILAVNNSLEDLDLSSNRIAGLSALGEGLAKNTGLKQLHLELNWIANIAPLARALEQNQSLTSLDLRANYISDESQANMQSLWRATGNDEAKLAL